MFNTSFSTEHLVIPWFLASQSKKKLKYPFERYVKLFFAYADGIDDGLCLEDGAVYNMEMLFVKKV